MARLNNRLSTKGVESKKLAGEYPDGAGLYLVVSKAGTKSWSLYYTLYGRSRQMGLGAYPSISLAEARTKRDDCRKLLANKIDPLEARRSQKEKELLAIARNTTFQQCAEAYIKAHETSWKNKKHIQQWKSTLATYTYPVIGSLPVQDIDIVLVQKVLDPIWEQKTETAERLRGRIEKVLGWARVNGHRQGENPARWKENLDNLLPNPSRIKKVTHHPALPYSQIAAFMRVLKTHVGIDARALEFTILTACRTNEITSAIWEEIDFKSKMWVIPASRMKTKTEHRVPLSEKAIAVLKKMKTLQKAGDKKDDDIASNNWIFPGQNRNKSLSNMAMLALLRRMNRADITVHGFRSTFRDWAAEQTSFPREVAEAALAHTVSNKVEAAYRRSDLFDKRRKLMDEWGRYCLSLNQTKKLQK